MALQLHLPETLRVHVTPDPPKRVLWGRHDTPLGSLFLGMAGTALCILEFIEPKDIAFNLARWEQKWPRSQFAAAPEESLPVVESMFFGEEHGWIDQSVTICGTEFQIAVWRELAGLMRGEVVSYGDIARMIGRPEAVRAVGMAVGANPISILIPCHRVIGSDGELHGYRWGLDKKRAILALEGHGKRWAA
jgi:AraC family transcriptional regulator of adaptative response/methylated-DNA-[protein]-cysteine methyltransferase